MNLVKELVEAPLVAGDTSLLEEEIAQLKRVGMKACARKLKADWLRHRYLVIKPEAIRRWNETHFVKVTCSVCRKGLTAHWRSEIDSIFTSFWTTQVEKRDKKSCTNTQAELIAALDAPVTWPQLEVVRLEVFEGEPPTQTVLERLQTAQEQKQFNSYCVIEVRQHDKESWVCAQDPLLLGKVKGCDDYFLIGQWGHDIAADDLTEG